ncbi:MAG: chromophore lyase CpcT/CpeT [Cyanobacteria bacterium P01_D01_bin.105]
MPTSLPSTPLDTLTTYLAGKFENGAQATESPVWFVHLRLWQRLVPALTSETTRTFFIEQASVVGQKPPYRQRIFQIKEKDNQLRGQYFALSQPSEFMGAGTDFQRLNALTASDLVSLPNSESHIQYQLKGNGYQFQSALPNGKLCSFGYNGQRRYVSLGFDIEQKPDGTTELLTYDKGVDPDTGQGLWGALMGPFRMIKKQ